MKILLLIATLAATMSARDSKGERFADKHRKQERALMHTVEAWSAYCRAKDMIPDKSQGCAAAPPSTAPRNVTPYTPPVPASPQATPQPSHLTHK